MNKYIQLFYILLITPLICKEIEVIDYITTIYRCENNEVICYIQKDVVSRGGAGGIFCKFKNESEK